jgi:membrane protein DedA with SNARE-associated domain
VLHLLPIATITRLLDAYGYWVVALFVGIESSGIPFPGETVLLVAAVYAGQTHHLRITWVIAAAAAGATAGDNLGYLAGREGGFRLVRRYGRLGSGGERRLKLGMWLFREHGAAVVFFGRFVAVLRACAAILAGINRMPWPRFLAANAAGGVVWATAVGLAAYEFGEQASRLAGVIGWVFFGMAAVGLVAGGAFVRRHEKRLEDEAERALPGPIDGPGG